MSATADPRAGDDADLARFGYRQELDRTLGSFATFAAGISYISILTGTFQLFYFGFAFGGPAYWWSWPLVFAGQLMVALCFAELASRYPIAGSIYNWSKRLSTPHVAWLAGWMMLTASIVTIAAVALAYQITLPQIDAFFPVLRRRHRQVRLRRQRRDPGHGTDRLHHDHQRDRRQADGADQQRGRLYRADRRRSARPCVRGQRHARSRASSPRTQGLGADWELGYLGAFLTASLASAYVMYGFDTASSLGEESLDPRRNAPKAILRALIASFLIGGAILLLAMMAVTDINSEELSVGGLQFIVLDVLGDTIGDIFLWSVVIAITVCCLAVHTAAIRMMFAMARDNNLPGGAHLGTRPPEDAHADHPFNPDRRAGDRDPPVVNIRQPQIFLVITSVGIIMIYIAYLLVTVPMLLARLRGQWRSEDAVPGYFTLGRWGLLVNALAVGWGLFMTINLIWPRQSIYNATEPFHWYLKWGGLLFVGVVMFGGFAYYWFVQRHKTGTLAEHAAVSQN